MHTVGLREIAYSRSGDKGNISDVILIPFDERDFEWMVENVTVDAVAIAFKSLVDGRITRYLMPGICALKFVMEAALQGGVSRSLALDTHGKARGSLILSVVVTAEELPPSRARLADERLSEDAMDGERRDGSDLPG